MIYIIVFNFNFNSINICIVTFVVQIIGLFDWIILISNKFSDTETIRIEILFKESV